MGDSGYKGISADQDSRFKNKDAALLKSLRFPSNFDKKVDTKKVELAVIKPWMAEKVTELLGFEDDVVLEYVAGMLEDERFPDPKKMQISLTGFLESQTAPFMKELWSLLLSAQESPGGIPAIFVERKKEEMRKKREEDEKILRQVRERQEIGQWQNGGVISGRPGPAEGSGGRRSGSRWDRGSAGPPQAQQSWQSNDQRGYGRGQGPSTFKDKSGNVTERVRDMGWGARAGPAAPPVRENAAAPGSHEDRRQDTDRGYAPRDNRERYREPPSRYPQDSNAYSDRAADSRWDRDDEPRRREQDRDSERYRRPGDRYDAEYGRERERERSRRDARRSPEPSRRSESRPREVERDHDRSGRGHRAERSVTPDYSNYKRARRNEPRREESRRSEARDRESQTEPDDETRRTSHRGHDDVERDRSSPHRRHAEDGQRSRRRSPSRDADPHHGRRESPARDRSGERKAPRRRSKWEEDSGSDTEAERGDRGREADEEERERALREKLLRAKRSQA